MYEYMYEKILFQLEQHKEERIVFWGASNFLKSFISNPDFKNYNIVGIIDSNKNIWNSYLYGYKIVSPDKLSELKPICIIDTVVNNYLCNYKNIQNTIYSNYKYDDIKLLPNVINKYYDNCENCIDVNNVNTNVEYMIPTKEEIEFFENLGNEYKQYSEMTDGERLFLTSLIQRHKPEKILEVGVSKGGSSFLILNAMRTYEKAKLYSLDYNKENYRIKGKQTGFLIDSYPDLKQNWCLKTGGLALNFLDEISSATDEREKFDFCLLDTTHALPGEIIDFLLILPYMKRDSVFVLHDTNLQLVYPHAFVNNLLMSSIRGHKFLPYTKPYPYQLGSFGNIGAIQLNETTFSSLYEIFNLLAVPWQYKPCYEDISDLIEFFDEHYPKYYSDFFKEVLLIQKM